MRFRAARMFRPACLQKRGVHIFSHTAMFCRKNRQLCRFSQVPKKQEVTSSFQTFMSHCFPDTWLNEKYKAYISKQKALISKYMARNFHDKPCVFSQIPELRKNKAENIHFSPQFSAYIHSRTAVATYKKIRKPHSVFRIPCPATETVLLRKQIPYNRKKAGRDFAYTPLGIYNKKSVRAFPARTDFNLW